MIYILCISFIYLILIAIVYFMKNKINNLDNKIYSLALIVSIINVSLDIIQVLLTYVGFPTFILSKINKIFLIFISVWTTFFSIYIIGGDDRRIYL